MGEMPGREVMGGMMLALAGLLLIIPGFVTDILRGAVAATLAAQQAGRQAGRQQPVPDADGWLPAGGSKHHLRQCCT